MGIGFGFGLGPLRVGVGARLPRSRRRSSARTRTPAQPRLSRAAQAGTQAAIEQMADELDPLFAPGGPLSPEVVAADRAARRASLAEMTARREAETAAHYAKMASSHRQQQAQAEEQVRFYRDEYDEQARRAEGRYIHPPEERASIVRRYEEMAQEHARSARRYERWTGPSDGAR